MHGRTRVNLSNFIFDFIELDIHGFSRIRIFLSPIVFIFIQNSSHVWPKLEPNLYPHGQAEGTCYQLMKAIDPSATKINLITVFDA
jgi:hypothetical protein